MKRREFLGKISAGASLLLGTSLAKQLIAGKPLEQDKKLNFVFFLIDDMGWKDIGCYGSSFYETPNIDKLASQSMRFTQAYAASPVCSPTRASILTGKSPARLKITDWIGGSQRGKLLPALYNKQLPLQEFTLAEALKEAGYATGYIGKWHLGDKGYFPEDQGFDVNVAGNHAGMPASYFYPYKNKHKHWDVPGLEGGKEGEYLTDRLTDEAISFLEENQEKPFLLYFAHYAVHTPIQSKEALSDKYRRKLKKNPQSSGKEFEAEGNGFTKLKQDNPDYAGMVQSVDESVGRIIKKLDDMGVSDDTAIIFMSDNGGLSTLFKRKYGPTSNVPLRAGKGWLYEGGIKVPMMVKWPGKTKPGQVCSQPVCSDDFYPTMLEMANLRHVTTSNNQKNTQHRDGLSLVPLLLNQKDFSRDALYWHFPHYHGSGNTPSSAIRLGDLKLIYWYEDQNVQLYNQAEDPSERVDLSQKFPKLAAKLKEKLFKHLKSQQANFPRFG